MRRILVTGSSGLIGSEVCSYFAANGFEVHGVDNNQRAVFFGPQGDTRWNQQRLQETCPASCITNSTSATAPDPRSGQHAPSGRHRPHRRAAFARSRRGDSVRRLRHQRRRHAEPARGRAPRLSRIAVRPHVDEQGLRRRAERDSADRAARRAGTTPTRPTRTASRRRSRSTSRSTRCSARRRSPPT